jgi:hypothetical protein
MTPTEWEEIIDNGVKDWKGKGLQAVLFSLCWEIRMLVVPKGKFQRSRVNEAL